MKSALRVLILLFVFAAGFAQAAGRMNVLFITSDDLGLQLSCYGDKVIKTPNLDAFAESGTLFEVGYVSQASCSPSRSTMFTGYFPHTNGQIGLANRGFTLDPAHHGKSIVTYLKNAGYRAGILGKLHVAPEKSFPFDFRERVNTRDVAAVANKASEFLSAKSNQPFFLMVNYSDPHIQKTFFPAQVNGIPANPLKAGDAPPFPFQQIDDPEQLERVANYYNCALRIDHAVGLLLDALGKSGHDGDTLVIFVGDHGPPFARGKTTCYEAGLRVPFIVRWPGESRVKRSKALVTTADIVPTILDATGATGPEDLHGMSLRPVLAKPDAPWREFLAAEFHFHGTTPFYPRRAIRDQRFKLIHNLRVGEVTPYRGVDSDKAYELSQAERYDGTDARKAFNTFGDPPEFELYDLEMDPWEFHNLAQTPGHEPTLRRLKQALLEWRESTRDPFLDPAYLTTIAEEAR